MMAVSCTKAMLVILFFMHVKYEANWKYVLTIPAGDHVDVFDPDAGAGRRFADAASRQGGHVRGSLAAARSPVGARHRQKTKRQSTAAAEQSRRPLSSMIARGPSLSNREPTATVAGWLRVERPRSINSKTCWLSPRTRLPPLNRRPRASLRRAPGAGRPEPDDRAGRDLRLSRPQRRRQDDAVPAALDADPVQQGEAPHPRPRPAPASAGRSRADRRRVSSSQPRQKAHRAENLRHQGHLYGLSGRALQARQDEMLDRLGLARPQARSGRDAFRRFAAARRIGQGHAAPPAAAVARRAQHRARSRRAQRSVGLSRSSSRRRGRDGRADDASAGRSRQGRSDRDSERGLARGPRHARRLRATVGGDSITIQTDDPDALAAGDLGAVRLPGRGCRRRACGSEQPDGHSGSPGWSRRFPAGSTRSRSASRRWKTCSSLAPGHRFWHEREEASVG